MDWLTFVSSIVDQLISWPVAILAIVLLFMRQLKALLSTLRHFSVGRDSVAATFGEGVEELGERAEQAQLPPSQEEEFTPLPITEKEQALAQKRIAEAERHVAEAKRQEAEAKRQVSVAQERLRRDFLYSLADTYPSGAVVGAWYAVEQEATSLAERVEIFPKGRKRSGSYIFRQLRSRGIIDSDVAAIADDLRVLRNRAAHDPEAEISAEDAREYIEIAERLAEYLRRLCASDEGAEGY